MNFYDGKSSGAKLKWKNVSERMNEFTEERDSVKLKE